MLKMSISRFTSARVVTDFITHSNVPFVKETNYAKITLSNCAEDRTKLWARITA